MPVANSGTSVLVDSSGVNLAGFTNAAASNIKIQDSTIYTITSNAIGSNSNGALLLAKASGAFATLDSRNTFVTVRCAIQNGTSNDAPINNMALSVRGATVICTGNADFPEITAPMVGDAQTKLVYRQTGVTWNSIHPGTNIQGSQYLFEGGGDSHISKHPLATVKDVVMRWYSTSPSDFVLGMPPTWGTDNKPATLNGLRFISIAGNTNISMFSWNQPNTPSGFPNQAFDVRPDYIYDVSAPGTRPTALRRSYRRGTFTASASSFWGAVSINDMYLWIDPYTTLSAAGVLDSGRTYIRTVNYNVIGTQAADNNVDIVAFRFKPTVVSPAGTGLTNASVVVLNTNANCSAANVIGTFRARIAASGITDSTGQIVITEPVTKNYSSNVSYRTDSFVGQNRIRTQAWHKWWEAGIKMIPVSDSRNGLGTTAPELYATTDYTAVYRRAGSVFTSAALDMSGPQSPTVALAVDANYNAAVSTTGLTVTYATGVTTVSATTGTFTLDQIYKSIIDFHATATSNEGETTLPVTQNTGALTFGSELTLTFGSAVVLNAGVNCTSLVTTQNITFNGAGQPQATFIYTTSAGTSVTVQLKNVSPTGVAAVWNSSTLATELFQTNSTWSAVDYTVYYPPGSVGLVKNYARELYGSQRVAGSITLAAGLNTISFVNVQDVGITEASQSTVAAYTAIETASKFYDRTAVFRLTEPGIKLGQIATRSGTAIEIGTFNHVINQSAAAVYAIASGTITTKSVSYAGDSKYITEIATPPATITAATTEVITIAREDANGDSQITIQAAGVSTFEIWKITNATDPDDYATGTLVATVGIGTWRFLSAPGFKFVIRDQTTNYRVVNTADKGIYTAELFFGAAVQLAQAATVDVIDTKVDVMQVDLDAIKGTGFVKDRDSLINIRKRIKFAINLLFFRL